MKKLLLVITLLASAQLCAAPGDSPLTFKQKAFGFVKASPCYLWDATAGRAWNVTKTTLSLIRSAYTTGKVQLPELNARQAGKDMTVSGICLLLFSLLRR